MQVIVREVIAGCEAFDKAKTEQFKVLGVSKERNQVVGVDGNWHRLSDCSFVAHGTISVRDVMFRDHLFPDHTWDDGCVDPLPRQRRLKHFTAA